MNVAIDGPAGAGKSTIAKRIAKDLSYIYVDTGAMYRAIAVYLLENRVDGNDEAAATKAVKQASVTISYEGGLQHVILNGEDVTDRLRTEEVGNMASLTSAYSAVRSHLLELQRNLAKENDVLMDGRDIGTTVLPDAEVKIYLTAAVETRAKRRYDELMEKGEEPDLAKIEADIRERDERDMNREISPLKKADDAVEVDTSHMNIDEVTAEIIRIIKERAEV